MYVVFSCLIEKLRAKYIKVRAQLELGCVGSSPSAAAYCMVLGNLFMAQFFHV